MQGRPKGGKNRYWSKEEKIKIVKDMIENNLSAHDAEKKYGTAFSMAAKWRRNYLKDGDVGLENSKKPGNPLMKYSRRKVLSELEQLEYENMKLRIENERLKKGYIMEGDGTIVIFKK